MNTDDKGYFDFPDAKGEYLLHIKIPGFLYMDRLIIVGTGHDTTVHRGPLYVMLRSKNSKDCTSEIFTSKEQFDKAVRENKGSHD